MQGIGEIKEVQERSLTGTWDIKDIQRWSWRTTEKGQNTGITNLLYTTESCFIVCSIVDLIKRGNFIV